MDGANVSGCASDNNRTCASTSCTSGDGPCLTFGSIATRWGTYSPQLAQITTLNVMSNEQASDIMYLTPIIPPSVSGTYLNVQCALGASQQTFSGVLGTVTAKNRSTPQSLTAILTGGTVTSDNLFINTMHPSAAFTVVNSGTTWTFTQPITNCTPASCSPAEIDTWTVGDTVTGYNPISINLTLAQPTMTIDAVGGNPAGVFVTDCMIQTLANQITTTFTPNGNIELINTVLQSNIDSGGFGSSTNVSLGKFVNTDVLGVIRSAAGGIFQGGMIGNAGQ
jgi:hypothetical protein